MLSDPQITAFTTNAPLKGFFSLFKPEFSFVDVNHIVKTTRSLLAEWNSWNLLYSLRNGFQVVYLFDCMKTREPWTNC